MELAVIALVALYGHTNNRYGKGRMMSRGSVSSQPLVARGTPLVDLPLQEDTTASDALQSGQRLREAAYDDACDSSRTGVMATGRAQPFFTSAAKQASNPQMKQRNMELFTGTLDSCLSKTGYYQKKEEVKPLFDPSTNRQRVSSGGSAAGLSLPDGSASTGDLYSRFPQSQYLRNVTPVEAVRVGPGLGLKAGETAQGGFQQFYRVNVPNDNVYRKNSLPGRAVPGKAPVSGVAATPIVVKNKAGVEMFMDAVRPPERGRAVQTAAMPRQAYRDPGQSTAYVPEQYSGIATSNMPAHVSQLGDMVREPPKQATDEVWGMNPTTASRGVGAYTGSAIGNKTTNRSDTTCALLPPAPPGKEKYGNYAQGMYRAPATMRSLDVGNPNQTFVGPSGTHVEDQGDRGVQAFRPRTTTREQLVTDNMGFIGLNGPAAPNRDRDAHEPSAHGQKKARVMAWTAGGQAPSSIPSSTHLGGIRARSGPTLSPRAPASGNMTTDYAGLGMQTHVCGGGSKLQAMDNRMCTDITSKMTGLAENPYAIPTWQSQAA